MNSRGRRDRTIWVTLLREKRTGIGMTIAQCSRLLGVHSGTLSDWEHYYSLPYYRNIERYDELMKTLTNFEVCYHKLIERKSKRKSYVPVDFAAKSLQEWGREYRRRRIALGLTRIPIARLLGVHYQTVIAWETGKRRPTLTHLLQYHKLLAVIENWVHFRDLRLAREKESRLIGEGGKRKHEPVCKHKTVEIPAD